MTTFLDEYLTEYDPTLTADSYIDPVGTLIIWSAFGQQVFSNRVNSISNDVRNYTLNLFHHFLVRKLLDDASAGLSKSLREKYRSKDSLPFKQACLLLLENLFTYAILRHEGMDGVDSVGILGISKARRQWEEFQRSPILVFTHEERGQILVRQLGLGVSGRYKTPLVDMQFFDSAYQYGKPAFQARWTVAETFIRGNPRSLLAKLEQKAYPFLKDCASRLSYGGKLKFDTDVPPELTKAYARAFASPALVGRYARDFWLSQTELDRGAAGALLNSLLDTWQADAEASPEPRDLLERALHDKALSPEERSKLEQIAQVEPFLADCMLLFTLMASERTQSLDSVAQRWNEFGRGPDRLPQLAQAVFRHASLPAVKGSAAGRRIDELLLVARAGNLQQQMRALADYHRRVMTSRGQPSWLSVADDGAIKVSARTLGAPALDRWPPGSWYNAYYLPQFMNLVAGLQGIDL